MSKPTEVRESADLNLGGGSSVVYKKRFVEPHLASEAGELFKRLMKETSFEQRDIVVMGRRHKQPRLTAYHATDLERGTFTYSGLLNIPSPFTPFLENLKNSVQECINEEFDSVLLNYYRDGSDTVGWHADNEKLYGDAPTIASLSFGSARDFILRKIEDNSKKIKFTLGPGDLLVMKGKTQQQWQHTVPRRSPPQAIGPRINLTFRKIVQPETPHRSRPSQSQQSQANTDQASSSSRQPPQSPARASQAPTCAMPAKGRPLPSQSQAPPAPATPLPQRTQQAAPPTTSHAPALCAPTQHTAAQQAQPHADQHEAAPIRSRPMQGPPSKKTRSQSLLDPQAWQRKLQQQERDRVRKQAELLEQAEAVHQAKQQAKQQQQQQQQAVSSGKQQTQQQQQHAVLSDQQQTEQQQQQQQQAVTSDKQQTQQQQHEVLSDQQKTEQLQQAVSSDKQQAQQQQQQDVSDSSSPSSSVECVYDGPRREPLVPLKRPRSD